MTNNTDDLFGVDVEDKLPTPVEISRETPAPYIILQMIPAEGWRAVFVTEDPQRQRLLSLACFALVETAEAAEGQTTLIRTVRPIVVDEDGETNDVAAFDEFLCLIPPHSESAVPSKLKPMVEAALARRTQIVQVPDVPQ